MGGMDAASSTLGAIGGAFTPGQLQTLLNQTIIPITIAISSFYLQQTFKPNQLIGAGCIMLGSLLASVPFLTGMGDEKSNIISILIFTSSIFPSAVSNVYKEAKMKSR
jgi:drug/metabolite transporter (DMT)-like permease